MCTLSLKLKNDTTAIAIATNEACVGVIRWKLLFGGGMTLLIVEDVNLLRRISLEGEMIKFLAVGLDSPPSQGFPINV